MRLGGCGCSGLGGYGQNPDGIGAYHRATDDASWRMPIEAVGAEPDDGDTGALFDSYWDEAATQAALNPEGQDPTAGRVDDTMFTDPASWGAVTTRTFLGVSVKWWAIGAAGLGIWWLLKR